MSKRFMTIPITVWIETNIQPQEFTEDDLDRAIRKAMDDEDLDYEVEALIEEKLLDIGLDCDEVGISFSFNYS